MLWETLSYVSNYVNPKADANVRAVASGGAGDFFLAKQLTLSQLGGAHYPHPVLQAPPDFQTLRRPCGIPLFQSPAYLGSSSR